MTCPLSLLRQYNVNGNEIIEHNDYVIFGEFSWLKTAKTNYLMYGSGKDGTAKFYYTLGCVLYLLKNSRLAHGVYVRQAMTDEVSVVRRPDRKDMLAFLNGVTATSLSIDKYVPLEPPTKLKRGADNSLANDAAAKKPRLDIDDVLKNESTRKLSLDNIRMQKAKEQLAAKLDNQEEVTVILDNIKSLSETMSVEKIAAIKAKRIAKKRTMINGYDDIENNRLGVVVHMDSNAAKMIFSKERVIRTRANILQTTGEEFQMRVFSILMSVIAKEKRVGKQNVLPMPMSPPQHSRQLSQLRGYNRYDQQRFVQQREATGDFVIDTTKTYHGMTLQSVKEGGVSPAVSKPIVPLVTPQKRANKTPIIVVPSSETSLITAYNVRNVLQDLKFKTTQEVKAQNGRRENEILLQRRKEDNLTVPYIVVDNPLQLKKEDWDRVVAVFVMGPQWQFKGWPYSGNPVEIFSKIAAFHLKYDEMPVDANVARWAVKIIEINKTRRHLDRAAIMKFWEALDKHMVQSKQHLRF